MEPWKMEPLKLKALRMEASRNCARWAAWTGWLFQRGEPVTTKG